ncbi:MAG TPA: GNAT family N-acetyltransferase [Nocardioides sp.]|nr:GNAT family N-acetyltransferase [Nocardioides sp.]
MTDLSDLDQAVLPGGVPSCDLLDQPLRTEVLTGARAVAALGRTATFIDERAEAFSARSAWLVAAAEHLGGETVVVLVRRDEQVVALAALSVSRRRGVARVAILGGELNDYAQLHHADGASAEALARAVADWVRGHRRWRLDLGQLPEQDPAVLALAAELPGAVISRGAPIPRIVGVGSDYRVKRDRRRKATGAFNGVGRDGLAAAKVVVDRADELERWLPELIAVRRERDHACGRRSVLDDPGARAFHETVLRTEFAAGRGILHLMLVEGEVAGYLVVLVEGDTHRAFDGRVAEKWAHYRGGVVCDLEAVIAAHADPGVHTFDWLRGWTEAKFGNAEVFRCELRATSHGHLETAERWRTAFRQRAKSVLPRSLVRRIVAR